MYQIEGCVDPILYGFKSFKIWLHALQSILCRKSDQDQIWKCEFFGDLGHFWTAVESMCSAARPVSAAAAGDG